MNPALINPYIRAATPSILASGHHIRQRILYDYELIVLEEGQFTFIYAGQSYLCHAGDIIFIRPGIPHQFLMNAGEISQPHIHFDLTYRIESEKIPISFKDMDQMTAEEKRWIHPDYFSHYPAEPFLHIKDREAFLRLFYAIIYPADNPDSLTMKGRFLELLSILLNDQFPNCLTHSAQYTVIDEIKDCIDAGYGFNMNLDDFVRRFSYSKFYLEKKFKEQFGVSLIEYRNQKRMIHANELLNTLSVSKTAEELGYQSIYSFSRAYKNYYGAAPTKRPDSR